MNTKEIPLTLGVEEEYQIINPKTKDLHSYVQEFLEQGKFILPEGELKPEFMQSQIEVGSQVCKNIKEVRRELMRLRKTVSDLAHDNGLTIVAASTHPFASWSNQEINAGDRYRMLLDHMRGVAAQLLIFGFHIHVGIGEDKNLQVELMSQLRYFLPHILAMTTSSPFWVGRNTGLKSYRSVIFEMLPRTGIPPSFRSFSEFEDLVNLLGKVGTLKSGVDDKPDATKIWWDARPHPKFGTLEIRIPDICTRIDEAVCIVAIVQSLVAKLIQLRSKNQSWRLYRRHHVVENKWRAMRYGMEGNLIDFGRSEEIPMKDLAIELMYLVEDVAKDLDCWEEVSYIEKIVENGTSADRQLAVYEASLNSGNNEQQALEAVVDHLIHETLEGIVAS